MFTIASSQQHKLNQWYNFDSIDKIFLSIRLANVNNKMIRLTDKKVTLWQIENMHKFLKNVYPFQFSPYKELIPKK